MPKMKLENAYRHAGVVYGPSPNEAIDVPDEVAKAAGYKAEIPPSDPELKDTPADTAEASKKASK